MSLVFSGVQPTGNLHLGNYLGAIRNWVQLQNQHDCMFCIVDMHAITVPQEPAALKRAILETAAAYIACGIDAEKHIIFAQSTVSAHAELAWILNCHTPLGWLNRMTQFKEKAHGTKRAINEMTSEMREAVKMIRKIFRINLEQNDTLFPTGADKKLSINLDKIDDLASALGLNQSNTDKANLGLYSYPVLMAADILAYKATHVPVGHDQKQHLELSRDIAGAFNRAYGKDIFPLPEPLILGEATRVMSLRDGTKKMSKSDESDFSRIHLMDDADTISQKIKKAKSDMVEGQIRIDDTRPEATNLITIYAAIRGISRKEAEAEIAGDNFSAFKTRLADALIAHLGPIQKRMVELLNDHAELERILKKGTERAAAVTQPVMREVKEVIGFPV